MQINPRLVTVGGGVLAALAIGGAAFAAGRSSTPSPDGSADAATRQDSQHEAPTDLDFDGPGFCFEPVPGLLKAGRLDADLGGFEARYLGDGFGLASVEFGAYCEGGRSLKTNWVAEDGGWNILVTQSESAPPGVATRGPYNLSFFDGGFQFFVMALDSSGGQAGASDPSVAALEPVLDRILKQLAPDFREECFERAVAKDWADLASLGIGDPRPAIPEGIVPIRLDFTVREAAAADCPPSRPSGGPGFEFRAMFTDRYDNLFSIDVSAGPAGAPGFTATFQPGAAAWSSDGKHFSLNWRPGAVPDDTVRAIARILDPAYDSICAVRTRQLSLSEIEAAGFRVPSALHGFAHLGGNTERAFAVEPTEQCTPGTAVGFFAEWMLAQPDAAGLVLVVVRLGPTAPQQFPPPYDESRMIYWKDERGAEYWIAGAKAIIERSILLDFARDIDPTFDESRLTTPPSP